MATESQRLRRLARLHGVQTAYYDIGHERQTASVDALLAVLRALGIDIERPGNAEAAAREAEAAAKAQPVVVAWEGSVARAPVGAIPRSASATLELEDGSVREGLRLGGREGARWVELPLTLPLGYHRLHVASSDTLVIAAPRHAYGWGRERGWGTFLPLYALASERSLGIGDLADLERLAAWSGELGATVIGTLPLLASFLTRPFEPSPYAPASRLFWNELYADLTGEVDGAGCEAARERLESKAILRSAAELREAHHVDYEAAAALKRRVLRELAKCFFERGDDRTSDFAEFLRVVPQAEDYARFRAVGERQGTGWPIWPEPLRSGTIANDAFDPEAERYHLYAQYLMQRQLAGLRERAASRGMELYLDLPLGVHADSYDVWRERNLFASGISSGAPPDVLFTEGQDWGFPPVNPQAMRRDRYRYFIACIRNHLRYAGVLRLDHVMGLHRLYWVPHGLGAKEGVYVRYPADELYAILCLESVRHRSRIVGEDLGTVPREVRAAMGRHNIHRMSVVQFELGPDPRKALPPAPRRSLASINTHDMPPFAAFWEGLDIEDRRELGLLDDQGVRKEWAFRNAQKAALTKLLRREGRLRGDPTTDAVLRSLLARLACSQARMVLLGLEDLWLERLPQNVPGTSEERPNWRRKARFSLEEILALDEVRALLGRVNELRRR